jgi:hypothetical protein
LISQYKILRFGCPEMFPEKFHDSPCPHRAQASRKL